MSYSNKEYQLIPIAPIDHNAIPDAMKDFIAKCGMMGVMPFGNAGFEREKVGEMNFRMIEGNVENVKASSGGFEKLAESSCSRTDESEDDKVDRVLSEIENNNMGVLKFLEVNGMTRERSKKFIKRVVRLSLRYE